MLKVPSNHLITLYTNHTWTVPSPNWWPYYFLHRGNLDKAIDMFNKAINLAKSEMEMAHLYSLCDAAYAQTEVARKYGLKPPTL